MKKVCETRDDEKTEELVHETREESKVDGNFEFKTLVILKI